MNPDLKLNANPGAPKREISPYERHDEATSEDRMRQRAREEEAHPFLHYLTQAVPGLQPTPDQPAPDAEPPLAGVGGIGAVGAAGVWGIAAEQRLFETAAGTIPAGAQVAFHVNPGPAPAPLENAPHVATVTPASFPKIVFGEVQRMMQNGEPATQLRVQLEPPHLGKVELAFTYAQQKISVNVMAATQQAKDLLDGQLSNIRAVLHAHNLPTGELKVVLGGKTGPQGGGTDKDGTGAGDPSQRLRKKRKSSLQDESLAIT